jgi:RiboL-PSP-HEPN
MTRKRQPRPIDVFENNVADAERLLALTQALVNTRQRRMRAERRTSFGEILRIPAKHRHKLECVESDDVFVLLKPDGAVRREHFTESELRPLLRQAIVAISAAVEAYVTEKAQTYIASAMKEPPRRLREVALSLGDVIDIEAKYKRRGWGYRDLVEDFIEREASSSPSKIGIVMSAVGRGKYWPTVDAKRGVKKGTSEQQLGELYRRRNRIAHAADRVGAGRAALEIDDVEEHYSKAKEIVETLDAVL